ncbi:MAG: hypothetical protein CMN30_19630 [Sandaracinus sp.]|nr:hypothetical protein [Sandaracinus sp.]|tara:strand:+ start:1494 stop:2117 length:624 start_codon:yes stop_codon:yes gene_type:complete
MTTVTEAVKPLLDEEDESAIEDGDLARLCANPAVAQRFARMLTKAAREISPNRDWTPEDLRDVLETAVHGTGQETARVLEGRYFRKRLREQVNLADRYGDSFAVVVITMVKGVSEGVYSSVLDAVTERLRRTDMVFLYRRRFALVLPRMRPAALSPLIERVRELVAYGAGDEALERIDSLCYPTEELAENLDVLDWAEDRLRDIPLS